jgi:divinyl chlorophyllide a 8-vinyl-reductase
MAYTIIRPTAFFKSLCGQVERIKQGKPFLMKRPLHIRQVPIAVLSGIIGVLEVLGRVAPALAAKAELARIGRYYATESMLFWNSESGRYDAASTPSTGTETLFDFYARLVQGGAAPERGDHAVF